MPYNITHSFARVLNIRITELKTIPTLIFEKNLLKEDGVFVFEHGKTDTFTDHPNFVEHRSYGSVNFSIFRPLHQG